MTYEYLLGIVLMGLLWFLVFWIRKDLRKIIVWGSLSYLYLISFIFIFVTLISLFIDLGPIALNPIYWHPSTLFDLGRITRGYAIEDAIFVFFAGGITTFLYELFFRHKIKYVKKHKHHMLAFVVAMITTGIFAAVMKTNPIYPMIFFGFVGAGTILLLRKDLISHSLCGGIIFLLLYFFAFLIFNRIFPNFIADNYNLNSISGILVAGVPLEELLYALSTGLFWAPVYEYEHGLRVSNLG